MHPDDPVQSDDNHKRTKEKADAENAANVIRQKLSSLYADEPNAKAEVAEVKVVSKPLSKHQKFMERLSHSGKSLAEIQTEWHNYYQQLPDNEKHEVWQEFYEANDQQLEHLKATRPVVSAVQASAEPVEPKAAKSRHQSRPRHTKSVAEIKAQLVKRAESKSKLSARQHLHSLLFGLGMGILVLLIVLFSFFNERFIAPFIMPSKHVSSTPIIIDPNTLDANPTPQVIIPKINVEGPVVYDVNTIDDASVQQGLDRGVLHYATTPEPGQQGNVVLFGHSSGNIFNHGKAKFVFALLGWLNNGDVFYLTRNGKVYAYQVYKKEIVAPTDVSVIGPADKPDTATLITCDPPGTSWHRLVIIGQQISPSPTTNVASTAVKSNVKPAILPSNSISLWQRVKNWFTS